MLADSSCGFPDAVLCHRILVHLGCFREHYNHVTLTDHSPAVVKWIGSFLFFFAFALSPLAGKVADAGYFHHVVLPLFSICLLLLSFVGEEQYGLVFLLHGIGMGSGIGLVFVPSSMVALDYFRRWRGLTLGTVMSGDAFGGMVFSPILR